MNDSLENLGIKTIHQLILDQFSVQIHK